MSEKIMVSVSYDRIPREEIYKTEISVDAVSEGSETPVRRIQKYAATMEEILVDLHRILSVHPSATITMLRGATRPSFFGEVPRKGYELDDKTRDMIRDDLEQARKVFAPVDLTIHMRETKE